MYILDLLGTFGFAYYGAQSALQDPRSVLYVFICGLLTALGGGTIRELILLHIPFYMHDFLYIAAALLGVVIAQASHRFAWRSDRLLIFIDAIGLITFAYIGARAADTVGLGPIGMIVFAILTAIGGGVLSDVLIGRQPILLREKLYALPALFVGIGYAMLGTVASESIEILLLLTTGYVVRVLIIYAEQNRQKQSAKLKRLVPKNSP